MRECVLPLWAVRTLQAVEVQLSQSEWLSGPSQMGFSLAAVAAEELTFAFAVGEQIFALAAVGLGSVPLLEAGIELVVGKRIALGESDRRERVLGK